MRELIRYLKNQRGEALIESVISILILSLSVLAISTMLMASLKITSHGTASATDMQTAINEAVTTNAGIRANVTFQLEGEGAEEGITQSVALYNDHNIVSFNPTEDERE